MTPSVPFASFTPRSKIRIEKAFGVKLGPPGPALPGKVQLIVGLTPLAELVIVTLDGNGKGASGIGAADGNANVAVAADGLSTSKDQAPFSRFGSPSPAPGLLNGVLRAQKCGAVEAGPHSAKDCTSGAAVEPGPGVKMLAPENPDDPPAICTVESKKNPAPPATSLIPTFSEAMPVLSTVIPFIVIGAASAGGG